MEFLLFALSPPSNVARLVRGLQESLYRRWGLVSPLALPPLRTTCHLSLVSSFSRTSR